MHLGREVSARVCGYYYWLHSREGNVFTGVCLYLGRGMSVQGHVDMGCTPPLPPPVRMILEGILVC